MRPSFDCGYGYDDAIPLYPVFNISIYSYIYFILKNNMRDDGDDNDDEDVGVFLIPYQETAAIRQSC